MSSDRFTEVIDGEQVVRTVSVTGNIIPEEGKNPEEYFTALVQTDEGITQVVKTYDINGGGGGGGGTPLPDQTGNAGKFLTTDGTDASWGNGVENKATGTNSLSIIGTATTSYNAVNIGPSSKASSDYATAVGNNVVSGGNGSLALGTNCTASAYRGVAIGAYAYASFSESIQIGTGQNNTAETLQVWSYKLLDKTTGKIPTDRIPLSALLDSIYPVGSVYIGTQSTCPMSTLIADSTWELVSAGKALWTGDGTNGNTTIAAGLPNIKANLSVVDGAGASKMWAPGCTVTGAFVKNNLARDAVMTGSAVNFDDSFDLGIDASQSNSIYSDSATTVQPPAYVVNVWRRTA